MRACHVKPLRYPDGRPKTPKIKRLVDKVSNNAKRGGSQACGSARIGQEDGRPLLVLFRARLWRSASLECPSERRRLSQTNLSRETVLRLFLFLLTILQSHDAMRWILVCFLPACILTALLNSFVPPRRFGHGRVMLGLLVASAMLLFVPIVRSRIHLRHAHQCVALL